MINSKQVFKAGLCSVFGAATFSLFFWNSYMLSTGRFMVWKAFEGDSHFLMFALFLMPLLIGFTAGFGMIFYSFRLESKEADKRMQDRIADRDKQLEDTTLTSLERIDIILGNHRT
jgi:hypothetical protein